MSEDWFYIFKELEEEKGEEGGEQIGGKGKKIKEVGDKQIHMRSTKQTISIWSFVEIIH